MNQMMDAIVKPTAGPGLELRQVPVPVPGPGEVLIKIHKTAICGSDVHIYKWNQWAQQHVKPPQVIGHEYVGEVAELGAGVTGFTVGQRVSGEGSYHLRPLPQLSHRQYSVVQAPCRRRRRPRRCVRGSMSASRRATSLPSTRACRRTSSPSFDAFGNATHTALMFPLIGEDVLITGAGPIGIIAGGICKYAGARRVVITDVNEYRLDLARRMGVDAAVNTAKEDLRKVMHEQGLTEGFDVGLEMSGNAAAFHQLISVMRSGGKVSLLGLGDGPISVDMNQIITNGLTLQGASMAAKWTTGTRCRTWCRAVLTSRPSLRTASTTRTSRRALTR